MGIINFAKSFVSNKKDFAEDGYEQGNGVIAQIVSRWNQGESPRMTQSNMASYLAKYADQAWVYSCIRIIQSKAAGVPLKVYKKVGDDLEVVDGHPLTDLLERVNPFMSGYDLREGTHGFQELVGNAYWLKDKIVSGRPTQLYLINPRQMKVKADKTRNVVGYDFELEPGKLNQTFKPEEILHFKTWNPMNEFYGMAPISAARDASDTIMFSDQFNKAFFKNGAEPGGFLTAESGIEEDDKKRITSTWRKLHQGFRKAHSVAILDGGLKWQPTTANHKDMAFADLKRMSREDVLTVFGIPPIMVGVFDQANYSNAREQRRIFWVDCIIPRLRKMESVINEYLVKDWDENLIVRHDLTGVEELAEDADSRARTDSYNVNAGIMTINEIRKLKNLPDVSWGNTWWAPMGISPVTIPNNTTNPDDTVVDPNSDDPVTVPSAPAPAKPAKPAKSVETPINEPVTEPVDPKRVRRDLVWMKYKGLTERLERKWAPVMRRLFNDQEREVIHHLHASGWGKILNQNKIDRMKNVKQSVSIILFDRSHARTVFRRDATVLMAETIAASAKKEIDDYNLGVDFNLKDHHVQSWIHSKAFKFADEVNLTTEEALRRELEDAVANGETLSEVEDRIARVFDIARGTRTAMIARTEVISASNEGAMASYKQSGVVAKSEWVTSRDNRVRDEHQIDGEQVEIDAVFSNGLKYPGDPAGEPGNVINCRCTVAPIVDKIEGGD